MSSGPSLRKEIVDLHGGNADIEHDAVGGGEAEIVRDPVEAREAVLGERKAAEEFIDQRRARGDRALIAVDRDHLTVRGFEYSTAITAGAEGRVEIDAAVARSEVQENLTEHDGKMAGRSASGIWPDAAARHHPDAPGGSLPLEPSPTQVTASAISACAFSVSVSTIRPSESSFSVSLWP